MRTPSANVFPSGSGTHQIALDVTDEDSMAVLWPIKVLRSRLVFTNADLLGRITGLNEAAGAADTAWAWSSKRR